MAFSFPHVHLPRDASSHTHTAVILHRRRGNGRDFAEALFSSKTSSTPPRNLPDSLPPWRWVFPSARKMWNTAFEEELPAWFDGYSLTDTNARQELQAVGLTESLAYVLRVIEEEVKMLGGRTDRVVIGGMSQGMAMALWTLLSGVGRVGGGSSITETPLGRPFAGVFGICGWLPFSNEIGKAIGAAIDDDGDDAPPSELIEKEKLTVRVVSAMDAIPSSRFSDKTGDATDSTKRATSLLSTPVFLCHGSDDTSVDISLGQEAARILRRMGADVDWKVHNVGTAREPDARWLAEPEGFDDLVGFLQKCAMVDDSGTEKATVK